MTTDELRSVAVAAIKLRVKHVTLTLPPGWKPPQGFPRGELLSVHASGERNCAYRPATLLRWMERA